MEINRLTESCEVPIKWGFWGVESKNFYYMYFDMGQIILGLKIG